MPIRSSHLTALALLSAFTLAGAQVPVPRVHIANGTLAGVTAPSGIRIFKGVPFAAPPVRELRWKPPQPAPNWSGVRMADRFGNQCMQQRIYTDMMFRNEGISEDCLYLNVWAPPGAAGARLPVLVYFFGGGFIAGDGSEYRYDGESMARKGMIVVTTSYRLGIFGFFAHPELTSESPQHASGNYTLMDQAAALRWVRANIAAFGGDPKRVTIAGESAGSFAVSGQMASPVSKDLFAGAIGESGAFFSTVIATPSRAEAEQNGVKFAQTMGATSLAALRAIPALTLLEASNRPGAVRFGPVVDGHFFPESPAAIFAAGKQARVPLLAGWNSEESGARAVLQGEPTPENVSATLTKTFGDRAADAAKVFPASTPEEAMRSMTELASDRFIGYSTWKWLDVHAKTSGQPVYRYFYSRPRPATVATSGPGAAPAARGAAHSAEIEYAMGNLSLNPVYAWTPEDQKVSQTMQGYFANFVKTGNPNGPGLPQWPVGTVGANGEVTRMRIDVDTRAEPEPRAKYLFEDEFYTKK